MKVILLTAVLGAFLAQARFASAASTEEAAWLSPSPKLTPQEEAGVTIAKEWDEATATTIMPEAGANGVVRFVYGAQRPSIVCSPMNVCDIALQPGEQQIDVALGDQKRWEATPATTGRGTAEEVVHILLKPHDAGLETNLAVATDRRMYHFRLRSHATEYMPQISFTYPEDSMARWDALRERQKAARVDKTIPETGDYLADLSFDYEIQGEARWKPVRVYNDGKKTIIQMPKIVSQAKLPTLYLLEREAGLFTDEQLEIVNNRFLNDRYVVDNVFDKAILLLGTGDNRERVTIIRGGAQ